MFKVDNKNTKTMSHLRWSVLRKQLTAFVDFKQVDSSWA